MSAMILLLGAVVVDHAHAGPSVADSSAILGAVANGEELAAGTRSGTVERRSGVEALARGIRRWPERALDRIQLPHPLLGPLTVREMLFFTYHNEHHVDTVRRRAGSVS